MIEFKNAKVLKKFGIIAFQTLVETGLYLSRFEWMSGGVGEPDAATMNIVWLSAVCKVARLAFIQSCILPSLRDKLLHIWGGFLLHKQS